MKNPFSTMSSFDKGSGCPYDCIYYSRSRDDVVQDFCFSKVCIHDDLRRKNLVLCKKIRHGLKLVMNEQPEDLSK